MKRGGRFLLWILFGLLVVILFTYLTQQLWNWLVPELFSGPAISFWQAFGLLVLSKILFSGFGRKGCYGPRGHYSWKGRLHEKFSHMSADEREAFKRKMREKWCPTSSDAPSDQHDANG
jgi:hypothetical protein